MLKVTHGNQEGRSGNLSGISDVPGLQTALDTKLNISASFSGVYGDLSDKPSLFSGNYSDLAGNPILFSGNYDTLINKPVIYSYFPIWAEENADIADGTHEWAFGNGANTTSGMGVVLSFSCELIGLGLSIRTSASVEVEVWKNTSAAGKSITITNGTKAHLDFEGNPIGFAANDAVNFKTVIGSTTSDAAVITAWFRRIVL